MLLRSGKVSNTTLVSLRVAVYNKSMCWSSIKNFSRYAEAEAAIIGGYYKQLKNLEEIITQFGEQACFSLQIIAKIYYKMMRTARGNEAHKLALKLNPFLWHSFEELCNVGEKVEPAKVFQLDKLDSFAMCHGTVSTLSYVTEPDLIVPGNNANNSPMSNGTNMYVYIFIQYNIIILIFINILFYALQDTRDDSINVDKWRSGTSGTIVSFYRRDSAKCADPLQQLFLDITEDQTVALP